MTDKETLKLVLEALEEHHYGVAQIIIREALAQPEQEPGTLRIDRLNQWLDASLKERQPAPQPEQEPVAWMKASDTEWSISFFKEDGYVPLYTTPPQRKPLTDEEISEIAINNPPMVHEFARAIEAAHGIKENT